MSIPLLRNMSKMWERCSRCPGTTLRLWPWCNEMERKNESMGTFLNMMSPAISWAVHALFQTLPTTPSTECPCWWGPMPSFQRWQCWGPERGRSLPEIPVAFWCPISCFSLVYHHYFCHPPHISYMKVEGSQHVQDRCLTLLEDEAMGAWSQCERHAALAC